MDVLSKQMLAALFFTAAFGTAGTARAQVAGSTAVGISGNEAGQVAKGWSVRKSILGRDVYNSAGEKIGEVVDLIIAPGRSVSYLIISAGGFLGIGTHDVAIPAQQVREEGGRIVIPGATKDNVKAMPPFRYAAGAGDRTLFIGRVEKDILVAKERLSSLRQQATEATPAQKGKLDAQVGATQTSLNLVEARLAAMKKADPSRWQQHENDVNAAMERLRASAGL